MEQIQKIIEAVRVEENYAFILDAGSNAGIIVAADKNLDITDRIVARLKATAPSKASAASKVSGAPVASPSGVTRPGTRPPAPH